MLCRQLSVGLQLSSLSIQSTCLWDCSKYVDVKTVFVYGNSTTVPPLIVGGAVWGGRNHSIMKFTDWQLTHWQFTDWQLTHWQFTN